MDESKGVQGRKLCLRKGPVSFGADFYWREATIVLGWVAETSAPNMVWMRIISIKLGWPPVRWVTAFTDTD